MTAHLTRLASGFRLERKTPQPETTRRTSGVTNFQNVLRSRARVTYGFCPCYSASFTKFPSELTNDG